MLSAQPGRQLGRLIKVLRWPSMTLGWTAATSSWRAGPVPCP